jgi:hypothetical protein
MHNYVHILKNGSIEQKRELFDQLLQIALDRGLEENELMILEALKKMLLIERKVVDMQATTTGVSNVGV